MQPLLAESMSAVTPTLQQHQSPQPIDMNAGLGAGGTECANTKGELWCGGQMFGLVLAEERHGAFSLRSVFDLCIVWCDNAF